MKGETSISMGKIMAFDLGRRRIGVAMTDAGGLMAHSLTTLEIRSSAGALEKALSIIRDHQPDELLVGHPVNMDGTRGRESERCRKFAEELSETTGLPVSLWDERLTTVMAERSLVEQGLTRKKRKGVVDRVAALLLLQDFIQHRRVKG
jgi:putative Holliday junction resolvase